MQISCPNCQSLLEVDKALTGHEVACPVCHDSVVIAETPPAIQQMKRPKGRPERHHRYNAVPNLARPSRPGGGGFFKLLVLLVLLAVLAFGYDCYQTRQQPSVAWRQLVTAVQDRFSPPPAVIMPKIPSPPPPVVVVIPKTKAPSPPPAAPPAPKPAPPRPSLPDPVSWMQRQVTKGEVMVTLLVDTRFDIIYNGKVVGSGNVPALSSVRLVSIDPVKHEVTVSSPGYGNGTAVVPITATDLLIRARTGMAVAYQATDAMSPGASEVGVKAPAVTHSPIALTKAAPASAVAVLNHPPSAATATGTNAAPLVNRAVDSSNASPRSNTPLDVEPSAGDPDLPAKLLPPGRRSDLITAFVPIVRETRNASSGLLHPGILLTKAQLDTMQRHVRAGDQPWTSAFEQYSKDAGSSTDPRIYYEGWTTIPAGGGLGKGGNYVTFRMAKDASTAFKQTVMWYITGNEAYRLNALKIIRDYCAITSIFPHWDAQIRWGVSSYQMCCAADVLRSSDGNTDASKWIDDDTAKFSALMKAGEGLVVGTGYWMNQHGFSTAGEMGTAIFLDDKSLYNEAVERTTVNRRGQEGGRNGSIKWQMRLVTQNYETHEVVTPQVQLVEMVRDQNHAWINVAALSTLCQTIYNQGTKVDPITGEVSAAPNAVDAFDFLDHRLLAGTDYITRYTLGEPVTWIPIDMGDHINDGKKRGFWDLGILYNHFKYIEGWKTSDPRFHAVAEAYESLIPETPAVDFPVASTLLLTPDAGLIEKD
jgi:hypothetical protein